MSLTLVLIIFFGAASYIVGLKDIWQGKFRPSVFSRFVWLLLAINSFAGVLYADSGRPAIVLAAVYLAGNIMIALGSLWRGVRTFGRLEIACLGLLGISAAVWMLADAPLVNLVISLAAHFIGAIPTYRKAWRDPESESTGFWALFFVASAISLSVSLNGSFKDLVFPLYFTLFEGSLMLLSARRSPKKIPGTVPEPEFTEAL